MPNYNKLNYEFEIYDYFKSCPYKLRLTYDWSSNECLLDNNKIDPMLFKIELQEKHNIVFTNGDRFMYALKMYCKSRVINEDILDSYTLQVNDIITKLSTEYINSKDILIKLNIHPSNFKKEEPKVVNALKALGYISSKIYNKELQKQLRVWVKDNTRQLSTPIDKVLDKIKVLSNEELDKLDKVLTMNSLSTLPDNIQEQLNNNYIEINQLKQENNKLLQNNLELADSLNKLETKEATPVKEVANVSALELYA